MDALFRTIIHPDTGIVLYAQDFAEGEAIPEPNTDVKQTVPYAIAKFDFETNQYYEAGTPEEVAEWQYQRLVSHWVEVTEHVNEDLRASDFEGKTNAQVLDPLYPEVIDRFRVYAPQVGSGTMYFKMGNGWSAWPLSY